MKILIITQYFYPESFRINDLTRALMDLGHEITVLTGLPNYPQGQILLGYSWTKKRNDQYFGATVYRVPIIPRQQGGKVFLSLNYLSFVLSAIIFGLPRLRKKNFDCCFVFATSPITAAIPANLFRFLTGCPVGIWIQDLWPDVVSSVAMIRNPKIIGYIGALTKWIYRHSDRLFIQSESFRTSVLKWGGTESQIRYLPNWAEDFTDQNKLAMNKMFFVYYLPETSDEHKH